MIIDKVQSIANYKGISDSLDKAIRFIQTTDLSKLAPGRHPIEGDDILAIVLTVKTRTRENCRWESHKNYIEIPIVIEGNELMIGQHIDDLGSSKAYDSNTDNLWYEDNGQGTVINMAPDIFAVFFPNDAHMPCIMDKRPEDVKKVIVKVKI
ncbi:YhcH/YjgK/YiaL family protein [Lachnospiraceae bacterium 54-53]